MRIVSSGFIYNSDLAVPEGKFACIPSLVMLADGAVLCSFKTGPAKISADDNVHIVRSVDGCKTWQTQFAGFDTNYGGIKGSVHSCYISEYRPGNLIASCCWVDRSNPDLPYANPQTGGILPVKCLLTDSFDGGYTWDCFRQVNLRHHNAAIPSGRIVVLGNGNLAMPYENWKQWDDIEGNYSSVVVLSKDCGKTWSWPIVFASDPFAERCFWDGKIAVNPATGQLLAALWTLESQALKDMEIHIVWGSVDGRQWSDLSSTGLCGQTTVPLFLDEKTVFLAYVRRDNGSIEAVLSDDMGKTWNVDETITLFKAPVLLQSNNIYGSFYGGPDAIRIAKDAILVVFYAGDQTQLSIYYSRIKF